jgi:thiamine biosynthesis lipoprotein
VSAEGFAATAAQGAVLRRARPALGTLVELGLVAPAGVAAASREAFAVTVLASAWRALAAVERALSAFDPDSDIGRFNAAPAGARLAVGPDAARVLGSAASLAQETGGAFDVTLGTGPRGWRLERGPRGALLHKDAASVRFDLGGIGKGHAVDRCFAALRSALRLAGAPGGCWVNAGGDLRVAGLTVPVRLRDEGAGGARPWLALSGGALATSAFGPGARALLAGGPARAAQVSVAAPRCLWADALTKVVALTGRADHPLLARHGATAWIHRGSA